MTLAPVTLSNNLFLSSLTEAAAQILQPHLKLTRLDADETVYNQDDPILEVYFPLDCVLSTVVIMNDGATMEVSMLGREGIAGISAALGDVKARNWTRVLIPGNAFIMSSQILNSLYLKHAELQAPLLAAYRTLITQVSQRAVCNGRHTLLARLATWLLMVGDRVGAAELRLTQDMIAQRLGSRRAGVTEAAQVLHRWQAINYKRGHIQISDPSALEHVACECYQTHKSEFYGSRIAGGGQSTQYFNTIEVRR
ncbi:MAG TPA: Crp/Fnr family transcriptional regulator [Pyrinomonadaceae bacterium]|jgi:CRP-like cAMP-binding protein